MKEFPASMRVKRRGDRLKPGQHVGVDVRGRLFTAVLVGREPDGDWRIEPDHHNITYYHVRPRQIVQVERAYDPRRSMIRSA